jgi:proteasome regulatory subunit
MFAIRDDRTQVTLEDFLEAYEKLQETDEADADDSLAFA